MSLNRIAVGPVSLKGLYVGQCRPLSRNEVDLLRKMASGVAVSLPRFFDAGSSSSRAVRDSRRPHKPEKEGRDAPEGEKPPRARPYRTQPRSRQARPPRPQHPVAASHHNTSQPRPQVGKPPANAPPRTKMRVRPPTESSSATTSASHRPEPVPRGRRIIGLRPNPPAGAHTASQDRRSRKRLRGRKRQPPRARRRRKQTCRPSPRSPRMTKVEFSAGFTRRLRLGFAGENARRATAPDQRLSRSWLADFRERGRSHPALVSSGRS